LNVHTIDKEELSKIIFITGIFLLLSFILSVVLAIYQAKHESFYVTIQQFLTQGLAVVFVFVLLHWSQRSLTYMVFAYGSALIISNLIITLKFFLDNRHFLPRFFGVKKSVVKSILSLGSKFFILQILILFILSSDKFLIAHLIDPASVTAYEAMYKYFSLILVLHNIINMPLWTMYTTAYIEEDFAWIRKTIKRLIKLTFFMMFVLVLQVVLADEFLMVWLGIDLHATFMNYILMATMILFLIWQNIFAIFTNGINRVKVQIFSLSLGAVLNIPLTIFFVRDLHLGLDGVLLATIGSLSIFNVAGPLQVYFELRKK